MTDRRKFLQLIASACAVAACPKILLPAGATIQRSAPATYAKVTAIGPAVVFVGPLGIYELRNGEMWELTSAAPALRCRITIGHGCSAKG